MVSEQPSTERSDGQLVAIKVTKRDCALAGNNAPSASVDEGISVETVVTKGPEGASWRQARQ